MKRSSNVALVLVLAYVYSVAEVSSNHHRHSHSHHQPPERSPEIRRSGRFICNEQPEDVQRLRNHWEQWELHCRCPNTTAPVCGSDGVTYHNRCHLECTARNIYQGFNRGKLRVVDFNVCPDDEDYSARLLNSTNSAVSTTESHIQNSL